MAAISSISSSHHRQSPQRRPNSGGGSRRSKSPAAAASSSRRRQYRSEMDLDKKTESSRAQVNTRTVADLKYFSSKRYHNLEWIAGPGDPPTTFIRRAGGQQLLLLFRGDGPRRGRPHALLLRLGAQLNLARRGCVESYCVVRGVANPKFTIIPSIFIFCCLQ